MRRAKFGGWIVKLNMIGKVTFTSLFGSTLYLRKILIRIIFSSIIARYCPIQFLGPAPNGMYIKPLSSL